MSKTNIMVLVSGNGTTLQALMDAEKIGGLGPGTIALVVSSRSNNYALERAKIAGVPSLVVEPDKTLLREERRQKLSDQILRHAEANHIDLIVLGGFLAILSGEIIGRYSGRIINLHPSLLPKFGGEGMYGERVHRAVLEAGETESGCTVHLADNGIDTGPILIQRKVSVLPDDTVDSLEARIHKEEHIAIVEGVRMMSERLSNGGKE